MPMKLEMDYSKDLAIFTLTGGMKKKKRSKISFSMTIKNTFQLRKISERHIELKMQKEDTLFF